MIYDMQTALSLLDRVDPRDNEAWELSQLQLEAFDLKASEDSDENNTVYYTGRKQHTHAERRMDDIRHKNRDKTISKMIKERKREAQRHPEGKRTIEVREIDSPTVEDLERSRRAYEIASERASWRAHSASEDMHSYLYEIEIISNYICKNSRFSNYSGDISKIENICKLYRESQKEYIAAMEAWSKIYDLYLRGEI